MVKICVNDLQSSSHAMKQSVAAKLKLLAKNRADNRVLIGESGAVPALISLLQCNDPWTQEHAITMLFNLSLHESNKVIITNAEAIKLLMYVLKTGTETSKHRSSTTLVNIERDCLRKIHDPYRFFTWKVTYGDKGS
ncbi:hypothetical protein ACFX13_048062 [Malus domestica]